MDKDANFTDRDVSDVPVASPRSGRPAETVIEAEAPLEVVHCTAPAPDRISTEDGDVNWFLAEHFSKSQAGREVAAECEIPVGELDVRRVWMRPATTADPYVERWHVEEGRWIECARTDPGAFAVWRVD